jgi:hypothetical protein
MTEMKYLFYECENSTCGLRFPGYAGHPHWNRCPICRSSIHVVAIVNNADIPSDGINTYRKLPVEVLLDNIRSAFNVGSIFRTSDGAGVQKIYCCGIYSTDNRQKTALGAETIPGKIHQWLQPLKTLLHGRIFCIGRFTDAVHSSRLLCRPRNHPFSWWSEMR